MNQNFPLIIHPDADGSEVNLPPVDHGPAPVMRKVTALKIKRSENNVT
jgi:hypothetical protein